VHGAPQLCWAWALQHAWLLPACLACRLRGIGGRMYFSFSAAICAKTAANKVAARIRAVPDDRLLLESDQACAGTLPQHQVCWPSTAVSECAVSDCAVSESVALLLGCSIVRTLGLASIHGRRHSTAAKRAQACRFRARCLLQVTPLVIDAAVHQTLVMLAEAKGWTLEQAAHITHDNFSCFYAQQLQLLPSDGA
jgi:Tat protein secretion system quality control protein TatD with DNase activity